LNLAQVLAFHRKHKAAATLVLRPDADADRYGSIDIDAGGRICRFLSHQIPRPDTLPVQKLMFTGVQVLEPKIFAYMDSDAKNKIFSTTKETYPRMLRAGEPLFGYRFDGFWQDLGTTERIEAAEASLAQGRTRLHFLDASS
jgi:NDP-sugar pyrophosphorylase family protein